MFVTKKVRGANWFCASCINRPDKQKVHIDQESLIMKLLNQTNLNNTKAMRKPMHLDTKAEKEQRLQNSDDVQCYKSSVGFLKYLAVKSGPVISVTVSMFSTRIEIQS